MPPRKPVVLFVCVGNACRSQIAEGWARELSRDRIDARSAGTHPLEYLPAYVVSAMREVGIDVSGHRSRGLKDVDVAKADWVITLGCCPARMICPIGYEGRTQDWDVPDPFGRPMAEMRAVRDDIRRRVEKLLDEIEGRPEGAEP